MAYQSKVVNGVIWSAIERFSVQGIQFLLSIVLARLVVPSDYGMIAMLSIFLAVAQQFVDSGFSNALVQKKNRSEIDFSTVFYTNLVIAIVIYSVLFAAAPWIARFYAIPQLEIVTKWIGLIIILSGFSIVQRAKLTIELDFKTQAKISLFSVIVSGVCGILLAWYGYGVWALVVQNLANSFFNTILLWIFAKWKLQLAFSWQSFRSLFSFGSKLLLVGILHVFYSNIYTLIIGKKYSASDVGYFNRSQTLSMFPSVNISQVITRALYPMQCEIQDNDIRLKESFLQSLRLSVYVVFPLMVLLGVLADPIIRIMLTDKWLPSAPILSILCLAYIWYPIMALNWQLVNVKGKSNLALKAELWGKSCSLLILIITIPIGLKAICWGIVFSNILDIIIMIHYVKKVMTVGYKQQAKSLFPFITLAMFMGIVAYGCTIAINNPWLELLIGGGLGLLVYFGMSWLFHFRELGMLFTIIKK